MCSRAVLDQSQVWAPGNIQNVDQGGMVMIDRLNRQWPPLWPHTLITFSDPTKRSHAFSGPACQSLCILRFLLA